MILLRKRPEKRCSQHCANRKKRRSDSTRCGEVISFTNTCFKHDSTFIAEKSELSLQRCSVRTFVIAEGTLPCLDVGVHCFQMLYEGSFACK